MALLTACGSAAPAGSSALVHEAPSSDDASPAGKDVARELGIPPEPNPATWKKYIAALEAIDPDIVHGKEEKAVDRGRNQCSSVQDTPDDQDRLVDLTNQRFTSPLHPEGFGTARSTKILKVVRTHICPDF